MKFKTFDDLFIKLFSDIEFISKEAQALYPKLIAKAQSQELKDIIEEHIGEIEEELERIQEFLQSLKGSNPQTSEENPLNSIFTNAEKLLKDNSPSPLFDAVIITVVQQIEHLEAAAYSSLEAFSDALDIEDLTTFFEESIRDVHKIDEALDTLAKRKFFSPVPLALGK